MATSTKSLEPAGSALTPYLGVKDAAKAIAFYQKVFGAHEDMRLNHPESGKVVHAQITINGQVVMLADAYPEQARSSAARRSGSVCAWTMSMPRSRSR
jgi:PhnB protein